MPKITNEMIFEYARTLPNMGTTIDAAIQTANLPLAKAAMKYLRTVYSMAHPKPSTHHYDETRELIIQLDEMGTLDSM